jgi:magnesium chelatase family protein
MISRYQKRISIPTLRRAVDRIDIHVEVPRVDYDKLTSGRLGEPSEAVRQRVEAAREVQRVRFDGSAPERTPPEGRRLTCNADMGPAEVRQYCEVGAAGKALLRARCFTATRCRTHVCVGLHMSARAYHRILKLARTTADLVGSETIQTPHLAPAS